MIVSHTAEAVELTAFHALPAVVLIASVTLLIASFAAVILSEIVVLIVSHTAEAVELTAFHAFLATFLIPVVTAVTIAFAASSFSEIVVFILSTNPEIAPVILSQTAITVSLQFSQINLNGSVIIWKAALKISLTSMTPNCTTFLIFSHAAETVALRESHRAVNVVRIGCTIVSLNHPDAALQTPETAAHALDAAPLMPSHSPEKKSATGCAIVESNHAATGRQIALTTSHAPENASFIKLPTAPKMDVSELQRVPKNEPQPEKTPLTASHAPEKSPWSTDFTAEKIPAIELKTVLKNDEAMPQTALMFSHAILKY